MSTERVISYNNKNRIIMIWYLIWSTTRINMASSTSFVFSTRLSSSLSCFQSTINNQSENYILSRTKSHKIRYSTSIRHRNNLNTEGPTRPTRVVASSNVSLLQSKVSSIRKSYSDKVKKKLYTTAKGPIQSYHKSHVPIVFVPGMKGSHLSCYEEDDYHDDGDDNDNGVNSNNGDDNADNNVNIQNNKSYNYKYVKRTLKKVWNKLSSSSSSSSQKERNSSTNNNKIKKRKRRVWLTLSGLFNIPPLPDDHPKRRIALPLSYTNGIQDQGHLFPDGIVEHVIDFDLGFFSYDFDDNDEELKKMNGRRSSGGERSRNKKLSKSIEIFPFYGHVTKHLQQLNDNYHHHCHHDDDQNPSQNIQESRPTATFHYDWRRPVPELSQQLHEFCESTFPNQPVQIIAHSLGGLISFHAMRHHPQKYQPGGVFVGVPFQTGIQYLQDLHYGYYTELTRCRQFTPIDQFTFASHWIFFPIDEHSVGDLFVDVSDNDKNIQDMVLDDGRVLFQQSKSKTAMGKKVLSTVNPTTNKNNNHTKIKASPIANTSSSLSSSLPPFQPKVYGQNISINFHHVHEWEKLQLGIFNPIYKNKLSKEKLEAYKYHMKIQLQDAKKWREDILLTDVENKQDFPKLVICASDTIPTVNQILRRRVETTSTRSDEVEYNVYNDDKVNSKGSNSNQCLWEYDYTNGRSVPGDGRIDFDKAFPEIDVHVKKISLTSLHAKQMCWEDFGGNFGTIWNEVREQLKEYEIMNNDQDSKNISSSGNNSNKEETLKVS